MKLVVFTKIYKKHFALHGILAPPTSFITRWTSKIQISVLKTCSNILLYMLQLLWSLNVSVYFSYSYYLPVLLEVGYRGFLSPFSLTLFSSPPPFSLSPSPFFSLLPPPFSPLPPTCSELFLTAQPQRHQVAHLFLQALLSWSLPPMQHLFIL